MEKGSVDEIFYNPQNPYTVGLHQSVPKMVEADKKQRLVPIDGSPPDLMHPPRGARFHHDVLSCYGGMPYSIGTCCSAERISYIFMLATAQRCSRSSKLQQKRRDYWTVIPFYR